MSFFQKKRKKEKNRIPTETAVIKGRCTFKSALSEARKSCRKSLVEGHNHDVDNAGRPFLALVPRRERASILDCYTLTLSSIDGFNSKVSPEGKKEEKRKKLLQMDDAVVHAMPSRRQIGSCCECCESSHGCTSSSTYCTATSPNNGSPSQRYGFCKRSMKMQRKNCDLFFVTSAKPTPQLGRLPAFRPDTHFFLR